MERLRCLRHDGGALRIAQPGDRAQRRGVAAGDRREHQDGAGHIQIVEASIASWAWLIPKLYEPPASVATGATLPLAPRAYTVMVSSAELPT